MAKKGTKKALSVAQEDFIAKLYGGERSPSSGAAVTDAGDVKTDADLFECKYSGSPENPLKTPVMVQQMEKLWDEAHEVGREPALALRWYLPNSRLADTQGWVDFTVRLTADDAGRSEETTEWMDRYDDLLERVGGTFPG